MFNHEALAQTSGTLLLVGSDNNKRSGLMRPQRDELELHQPGLTQREVVEERVHKPKGWVGALVAAPLLHWDTKLDEKWLAGNVVTGHRWR